MKPLLLHIIEKLKRRDLKSLYFNLLFTKLKIIFLDGKSLELKLSILRKSFNGTVGCLSLIHKKIDKSFFS